MDRLELGEIMSALREKEVSVTGFENFPPLSSARGVGSFGSVYAVEVEGEPCIAKCLHPILIGYERLHGDRLRDPTDLVQEKNTIRERFYKECHLLSTLNHPNIVKFVGVARIPGYRNGELALIMEALSTDLGKFLNTRKPRDISNIIRVSLALDIATGLLYLHSQQPTIIHRDLSAANVLVSIDTMASFKAKIADLGVAKLLESNSAYPLTIAPGALDFMAPEALVEKPQYDTKLDIFSFGAVLLYLINHTFPHVYQVGYAELINKPGKVQIAKREKAITSAQGHCLYELAVRCLQDEARQRPTTRMLRNAIEAIHERQEEVLNAIRRWNEVTGRREITLVTAGRSGAGKSTLISSMLNLTGEAAPRRRHGASSTTTRVGIYEKKIEGVTVRMVDTPGLATLDRSETRTIVELHQKTRGKADMLLYCISLLPGSEASIISEDKKIIESLTFYFGSDLWKHTILVFTCANKVHKNMQSRLKKHAKKFQSALQSVCPMTSVVPVFSCLYKRQRDPSVIVAVPAGRDLDWQIEEMSWARILYAEVLLKCNRESYPTAVPDLFKVVGPTPLREQLGQSIIGFLKWGGGGSIVGGTIGAGIGAGLGSIVGGVGAIPGAALGAKIGAAAMGAVGLVKSGVASYGDKKEQDKLKKVHDNIAKSN